MLARRALATTVIAALVAGCSARPPVRADFSVPRPGNEFGEFVVDVYDSAELVADAKWLDAGGEARLEGDVVARPDASEVDVKWMGGACAHRPFIHVRGTPDALTIELDPDPKEAGLVVVPASCPAVGLFFGVTVTLDDPVDQANVTLTVPE